MKIKFSALGVGLVLGVALMAAPAAQANNFSPERNLIRESGGISLEKALERNSGRFSNRRPGLGAFSRRSQSRSRTAAEQLGVTDEKRNERRLRTRSSRVGGGRNGYARYLRGIGTTNENRVSRFRSSRATSSRESDIESLIRNRR